MSSSWRVLSLLLLSLGSIQAQLADPDVIERPWINEFHYDNIGTDVNEFIEVATPEGLDIRSYQLILYNGFFARMYPEGAKHPLVTFQKGDSVNGVTFYTLRLKPQNCSSASSWCGLQNGKDGFALAKYFNETTGRVVEFLTYEGSFVAKDGPAANMNSTDVGVQELSTTPRGWSISKTGTGCKPNDFVWAETKVSTPGTVNKDQTTTCDVAFINEFHYQDTAGGEGQFIEVATNIQDVSTYSVVLYNGEDGSPYDAVLLSSFEEGATSRSTDELTYYYYEFPGSGGDVGMMVGEPEVNGTAPAGMALVHNDETVLQFISYGGTFTAMGGVAEGMTSVDVGVAETSETPVGSSIQLTGMGCSSEDFVWKLVAANGVDIDPMGETRGEVNVGEEIDCTVDVPEVVAPTAPSEEGEDDLMTQEDDFLDDAVVVFDSETAVSKTVTYTRGPDE